MSTEQTNDSYLYCYDHGGLVPTKDVEFTKGQITGHDFPVCKVHPDATVEVYNPVSLKKEFSFTMFEDRSHLS